LKSGYGKLWYRSAEYVVSNELKDWQQKNTNKKTGTLCFLEVVLQLQHDQPKSMYVASGPEA
jgi:hypothetical protein